MSLPGARGAPLTLSVIVPVYNGGAFLAEALTSVFAQSRRPHQVVVVDDGSTDGSAEVALNFPVTLRRQSNQGIGAARNAGLAAACCEVIAFLDADDLWPADSLAARMDRLESEPCLAGVYGLVEHFLTPGLAPTLTEKFHCPVGQTPARLAGSTLLRRSAFEGVGAFDATLRVGETLDWMARLIDRGGRLAAIDTLVMRRRIHGANTTVREADVVGDYIRLLRASVARKAAGASAGVKS